MPWKALPDLVSAAGKKWSLDNASRLGAALSYYTIFAIPPLFVVLIYIASLCLDEQRVQSDVFNQVGGVAGKQAASAIQSALSVSQSGHKGLIASIVAGVGLVLTATGL